MTRSRLIFDRDTTAVSDLAGRDAAFHAGSIAARTDDWQFGVSTAACGFCVLPSSFQASALHATARPLPESIHMFRIVLIVGGRAVAHCFTEFNISVYAMGGIFHIAGC
jgi:hypothetical protein